MTGPGQVYGYTHRGTITGPSELAGYWMVRVTAINPARPVGPYPSTVPEHAVGDRVLLTQIGTSRDDLVITGTLPPTPWESHLPIGIDDVTGLQTALDDRATDTELAALASSTDGRLDTLESADATQDGRLDSIEGVNTAQDGRLTTVEGRATTIEGVNTTQDGRLTAVEGVNTAQDAALVTLNTSLTDLSTWEQYQAHERDVYGDIISSHLRGLATNSRSLVNQAAYIFRSRVTKPRAFTQVRLTIATTAGVGGTTTAAVYKSLSATGVNGPYTLMNSGTNTLTALGAANFTVASSSFARGDYILLLILLNNGYSTVPRMATMQSNVAHTSILNPTGVGVVFGTKVPVTSVPATISPNDGTWTAETNPWWIAAA